MTQTTSAIAALGAASAGTAEKKNGTLVIAGTTEFTPTEMQEIKTKMTPETKKYLSGLNNEFMMLDVAEEDLQIAIRRAERNLRDTREYRLLMEKKQHLKLLRARRHDIRTKGLGVFESLLGGIRRASPLYKKLLMLKASEEE